MALLIMTVGLLGLLQSVNVAFEHSVRTKLREQALLLAEEQMNLLRTAGKDLAYPNVTTAVRLVGGVSKKYTVTRDCTLIQSTNRYKVTVAWSHKNVSQRHAVYTLKNKQ